MKVSTGCNPNAYQKHKPNNKHKGFADMFADMASNKHDKTEAAKDCCCGTMPIHIGFLRMANPHRHHGAQIKLTAGQLAIMEKHTRAKPSGSECLHKYEEVNQPELIISEPFVPKIPKPKYPASIYDIPASDLQAELQAAATACYYLDTEGMSKAEIYNSIETIYKNYLGKDFSEPYIVNAGIIKCEEVGDYQWVLQSIDMYFGMECRGKGVNIAAEPEILRDARGYTGMSDDEIRAAVREKYPKNMSIKDCILMADELWNLRLTDGNYGDHIKTRIALATGIGDLSWSPKVKEFYYIMLQIPADLDTIKSSYEAYAKNDYVYKAPHNMGNVLRDLISFFGGSELGGSELLSKLRALLDEMEKSGVLGFDEYGYLHS